MDMPSPKNTTRTMAEVRAECAALGLTPGRSVAECERRIAIKRGAMAEKRENLAQLSVALAAWPQEQFAHSGSVMREQARSFDTPKPKDQVRRDVRRKMRKATRQAQRRARG